MAGYDGYDFTFTKPVPEKFYCSICNKVLCDPHLTKCCGQNFCESCLKHWFKKKTTCPHCHCDNFNHTLNEERKREVNELEIKCTKHQVGCQWVGELGSLQTHLKDCRYMKTLKNDGDEVTLCMTNFTQYKQTDKVWHSPPFYYLDGYKLCLAVYANGKGAGAGTHVSVELLQMRGEHDDKVNWRCTRDLEMLSIKMMMQCKKAQSQEKQYSIERFLSSACFKRLSPSENLCVCHFWDGKPINEDKFIDHKSVEHLMLFNDTILLNIKMTVIHSLSPNDDRDGLTQSLKEKCNLPPNDDRDWLTQTL